MEQENKEKSRKELLSLHLLDTTLEISFRKTRKEKKRKRERKGNERKGKEEKKES